MSESKLLPCPLCGSEAELRKWTGWYVACKNTEPCGCLVMHDFETKEEAITAWNTRYAYNPTPSITEFSGYIKKDEGLDFDHEQEIDNLAKLMWAFWGGSDPDSSWKDLDETYKFKWKTQAELLIANGYRKNAFAHVRSIGDIARSIRVYSCWDIGEEECLRIGQEIHRFIYGGKE